MIVSLLILTLAGLSSTAHARVAAPVGGDTHASSDLGGEYVDEDEGSTDDLGSEDLDEGDTDPADKELQEGDPQS